MEVEAFKFALVAQERGRLRSSQPMRLNKEQVEHYTLSCQSTATMSPPIANPSRPQTRVKNANQHPGDAILKRKRRTKVEMAEVREKQRLELEAEKKENEERLQATAKLENEITAMDKQAATGTALKKTKATAQTTTVKKVPVQVSVQEGAQKVSTNPLYVVRGTDRLVEAMAIDNDTEGSLTDDSDIEVVGKIDSADNKAAAASDPADQNFADIDEDEEEVPRKTRKIQRGGTRENIKGYRKIAIGQDDLEGETEWIQQRDKLTSNNSNHNHEKPHFRQ